MISLVAFDLDGTLALSKQPLDNEMAEALASLLQVAHVAIISGGDWPQFEKQIAARLPPHADRSKLFLLPTTGTKLYSFSAESNEWKRIYADLFTETQKSLILSAFDAALAATGFAPEETWGARIEDRGSQITFSALGQEAPLIAKEKWDPDFAKRKVIQADLWKQLPDMSVNLGGATSVDITKKGVDKAYGLRRLSELSKIALEEMMFIGDAIFPGGNDYPAFELGLKTVKVKNPDGTLAAIAAIVACLS
ncbi:HAD-like domain-containing protein [Aspergillus californicus]